MSHTTPAPDTFTGFIDTAILFEDYTGTRSLWLSGWMLAGSGPLTMLELSLPGGEAVRATHTVRHDVAARNPYFSHALQSGFCASLPVSEISPEFHVNLHAKTSTQNSILSTILVTPSCSSPTHRVAPILLSHIQHAVSNNIPRPSLEAKRTEMIEVCKLRLKAFLETGATLSFPRALTPVISIIIPISDEPHLTLSCLETLRAQESLELEVILVDYSRSEETKAVLSRIHNLTRIEERSDFNFSHACNTGAKHARGQYLVFLNNDAFPLSGALAHALDTIKQYKSCGVVGAMLLRPDGLLQEAGSFILPNGSTIGRGRATQPHPIPQRFPIEVDYCSAAFLLTPRKLFTELGGFNEAFAPAYYEDVDYCVRARQAGYTCLVEPRAEVLHIERGSSNTSSDADDFIMKNRKLFLSLHPDPSAHNRRRASRSTKNKASSILVIDDCIPDPSRGQGQARACLMLETLHDLNLSISWYPAHGAHTATAESSKLTIVAPNHHESECQFLKRVISDYDLLLVSRPHHMEQVQLALRSQSEAQTLPRIIYDAEAIHSQREILRFQVRNEYTLSNEEIAGIVCNELVVAKDADHILTCSQREASIFTDFGFQTPTILSHGIRSQPTTTPFADRSHFLTIGPLLDPNTPNADGLRWFLESVLPLIQRDLQESDIALRSVGECFVAPLEKMQSRHFQLLGRIANLESVYARHRVCIAPTRFSAGIPLKVLEAAAFGVPSVVTPLLAHQLEWEDGVEVLVGRDPQDFATKCVTLYKDPYLWESIRTAALARVSREYSIETFKSALEHALF